MAVDTSVIGTKTGAWRVTAEQQFLWIQVGRFANGPKPAALVTGSSTFFVG